MFHPVLYIYSTLILGRGKDAFENKQAFYIRRSLDTKGEFHIKIADTGIGIAPEAIKGLFKPFRQGGAYISKYIHVLFYF